MNPPSPSDPPIPLDIPSESGVRPLVFVAASAAGLRDHPVAGARLRTDQVSAIAVLHGRVEDDVLDGVVQLPGTVDGVEGSLYAVPVRVGGSPAGSVVVAADHPITEPEASGLASIIGERGLDIVVAAARREEGVGAAVNRAVGEISRTVARSAQLPTVLPAIAALAARSTGFGRGSVLLVDDDGHLGVAASQHAGGQPDVRLWGALRSLVPMPAAFVTALEDGELAVFEHPESARDLDAETWVTPFRIKTVAVAPIAMDDRRLGLLVLDDERRRSMDVERRAGVMAVARAAADAIATTGLLRDERAALHRSQLVLATVVQAATQLSTSGVLTVIGEGINKVLGDATTVSFVVDEGVPSRIVVCGLGDGVLDIVDRVIETFGEGGTGADFIVMSRATHPAILGESVAGRAVALPLRRGARDLGWVVSYSPEDSTYPDGDLKVVAGIAAQAALSLHTSLLLEQERATVVKLEELGNLKTQFVASVSHELRTPLTAIIGYTELIDEALDDPTLHTYLDDMRRESAALEALISDLLDTSRIESGTLRLDLRIDDPARAVYEAVELVQHAHPGRSVRIDVDPETGSIPVDHNRFRQIITNLVDNAVKYSPENTSVAVTVRRLGDDRKGEHLEVTVTDQGPGIPVSQREAVFQRFNRLPTASHAGTGIGLYLVRALAEAHGGTVKVADASSGTGSRFIVQLPATYPSG